MFYYRTEENDYISSMSPYSSLKEITKEEYEAAIAGIEKEVTASNEEQMIIDLVEKGYTVYK